MKTKSESKNIEKIEVAETSVKNQGCFKSILKNKKMCIIFGAAAVLIFVFIVVCILSAKVSAYDKIYPNVIVEGINIGGLTKEEATEKLNTEYVQKLNQMEYKIVLADFTGTRIEPERSLSFKASDIEAVPDIELMVHSAYQHNRSKGFFGKMFAYYGAKRKPFNYSMPNSMNSEKINGLVTALAEGLETPIQEVSYSLKGDTLTIANGHGGEMVDRKTAENFIGQGVFSLTDEEILLWLEQAEPEKVNVDELYNEITNAQKDAYYDRVDGEIVIIDDFPKIELDKNKLKTALESGKDFYEISVKTIPAKVTSTELKSKLFRDNMGSWTSRFSASNVPRSSNVRLTASRINGITLLPGEVFSYDKTIGSRTAANGYKVAGVYVGNKVEEGIGGGICQTSSTLYSAVLYANLEIVSRTSHSLPVSYMPPGQDATIAEGYIDFKFKNNTDYPIKIVCTSTSGTVSCSILGVKPVGEKVEIINTKTADNLPKTVREYDESIPQGYKKISQKGAPGSNISSVRIVRVNGQETKRENLTKSVYKATDTIELVNPADKDVPSENLAVYTETDATVKEETVPAVNPETVPEKNETETENETKSELKTEHTEDSKPTENEVADGDASEVQTITIP